MMQSPPAVVAHGASQSKSQQNGSTEHTRLQQEESLQAGEPLAMQQSPAPGPPQPPLQAPPQSQES